MSSNQASDNMRTRSTRRSRDEGRRAEILDAAIVRFGRNGYESTKWAEIADDVGIGPTALYHYFDSKQHCLYVILAEALGELHERFDSITAAHADPRDALRAVCADCFALSEREVLRNRVLVAEQALLSGTSSSQREEQARGRLGALSRRRDAQGGDPRAQPQDARPGRPRPLQQHLALVPPGPDAAFANPRRVLRRPDAGRRRCDA